MSSSPHLLKGPSLFALFCLSYLPLFILLILKVLILESGYLCFYGFHFYAILTFFRHFGLLLPVCLICIYSLIGTAVTLQNIKGRESNAFPVKIISVKNKNDAALSYLISYVVPLILKGENGLYDVATFVVLFMIYYRLYTTSSLILINPILNMFYGLHEIEYLNSGQPEVERPKAALVISNQRWLEEDEAVRILKISNKLYFTF